jgi:hypothetical protein
MTKAIISTAFLTALTVLIFAAPRAQAATNFSGDWKMNVSKSDFGPTAAQAPEVLTRSIKHNDPALEIATHQKGAQGETNSQLKYTTDGKECVNKLPQGEAKGTAKWQGDNLVVESVREAQGVEIKARETWTLSDGGKVLTILNHVTIPQGELDLKYVFEKQ